MKDFFISYNSADRQWAEWIAWQLEEVGYTTVLQAWDFRPGSNFVLEMQRAATEAERTIAVLSPYYLSARFTHPEWAAAFAQDPTGEKGTLVPVRVRECELKGLLPQIVYIDLVGLDEVSAWEELLAGVSRERARPSVPPGFPGAAPRSVLERPRFPDAEECIGTIEFPANKSRVPHILSNVEGKCFNLPEGHWLWLVTFPHHFPSFHPQGAKFKPNEKNHWQGFAAIGVDRNESGTMYDLILVMADERASTRFEVYLRRARETNEWKGLDYLPAGSMELTRITVYRQKG